MAKKELFIPFDKKGNLLDYSFFDLTEAEKQKCKEEGQFEFSYANGNCKTVFVPNFECKDTLIFSGFSRGRSSVKAHFISEYTGLKYEMFISDFDDVLKSNSIHNCRIKGTFTFVKRGANYGIALLNKEVHNG